MTGMNLKPGRSQGWSKIHVISIRVAVTPEREQSTEPTASWMYQYSLLTHFVPVMSRQDHWKGGSIDAGMYRE
jgi:hypothetical protein